MIRRDRSLGSANVSLDSKDSTYLALVPHTPDTRQTAVTADVLVSETALPEPTGRLGRLLLKRLLRRRNLRSVRLCLRLRLSVGLGLHKGPRDRAFLLVLRNAWRAVKRIGELIRQVYQERIEHGLDLLSGYKSRSTGGIVDDIANAVEQVPERVRAARAVRTLRHLSTGMLSPVVRWVRE